MKTLNITYAFWLAIINLIPLTIAILLVKNHPLLSLKISLGVLIFLLVAMIILNERMTGAILSVFVIGMVFLLIDNLESNLILKASLIVVTLALLLNLISILKTVLICNFKNPLVSREKLKWKSIKKNYKQ